ncbi:MAG: hypothetical protein A2015_14875 [Spirochaetes bacterium GWF1_31_7]|nr:MAG: hypothetical protein A2Y30_12135 [Spirochaetes bacterium GWE1_32_154]OHD49431.1 MAG: hypothetical protein A2015_14875 [Spirochaetes bacterium GWF1_31_7]OHD80716.1 MAG: hypothetical protein A2355_16820 [Spirochaetes bacterium RIFOXYB1_FULL_32_8]HBD93627.1 hypothetical protein [Spirochaetia bacterium]HBI37979.1 hypothetical protein [Spirochaetia bacterium]
MNKLVFVSFEKERLNVESALQQFLITVNRPDYFDQLNYIVKELVTNAEKANLKRIYFDNKGFDINNNDEYENAIATFRNDMLFNYDEYIETAKSRGYYVELLMSTVDRKMIIEVKNNSELVKKEIERIKNKMQIAARFNSMEEVIQEVLDQTEGAGFGLILSVLILRKLGVDENVINIGSKDSKTTFRISLPIDLVNDKKGDVIAEEVVKAVDDIPQFPQHFIEVINVLNKPDSTFEVIGTIAKKDPSFVAALLKTANSAIYSLPKKVENINDAISLIGINGVKNFVFTYSTSKALMNKYNIDEITRMITHAQEVTLYAALLADKFKKRTLKDNLFVAGMLHDLGKIIIRGINQKLSDHIQQVCESKGINNYIIESLTNGYNHAIIGAKLAEKWNFPDFLTESIQFHHIPLQASDKNIDLVSIVYLADIISYYKDAKYKFSEINMQVLKRFGINTKGDFDVLIKPFIEKYAETKENFLL